MALKPQDDDQRSQTNTYSNEKEDVTVIDDSEDYPPILESAPFPALGSVEEIARTLSRVKSNQTQKSDAIDNASMKEETTVFKQVPYHTDGIRNPGWLTVLSCFLVNFFVIGTTFSWGNYQKL